MHLGNPWDIPQNPYLMQFSIVNDVKKKEVVKKIRNPKSDENLLNIILVI